MSPKQLLQGKWLGHPLHPALVHVPAGLWPAALMFDLVSRAADGGNNAAVRLAFWCACVGLAGALVAIPAGLADWWEIKKGKPGHRLGAWHMALNLAATAAMATSAALRLGQGLSAPVVATAPLLLCAAGNALVLVSGYLGGRMVFEHGASVARFSKKRWRAIAEEGHAHLPEEK